MGLVGVSSLPGIRYVLTLQTYVIEKPKTGCRLFIGGIDIHKGQLQNFDKKRQLPPMHIPLSLSNPFVILPEICLFMRHALLL